MNHHTDSNGSIANGVPPAQSNRTEVATDQLRALDRQVRAFVREHPVATVAGAVALGFLIGRVFRS